MNHYFSILLLAISCSFSTVNCFAKERTLKIYMWPNYLSEEIIKSFESKYGIKAEQVFFKNDQERNSAIATANGNLHDLWILDSQTTIDFINRGWIQSLPLDKIPNLKTINWKSPLLKDQKKEFTAPYGWGGFGVAYRKDLTNQDFSSWLNLFKPSIKLRGKILMTDQSHEAFPIALLSLGLPMNSDNRSHINQARELLLNQHPFVFKYQTSSLTEQDPLVTGEAHAAFTYNTYGIYLKRLNPNIEFIVPEEGSKAWVDNLVISRASKNKEAAFLFLNHLYQTNSLVANMKFNLTASFNTQANKIASKFIANSDSIFIDNFSPISVIRIKPNVARKYEMIWSTVTYQGGL